jgi:hypothetical protein
MRRKIIAAASAAAFVAGLVGFTGVETNAFASSSHSSSETTIHLVATTVDDVFLQPDGTAIDPSVTIPKLGGRDVFHDTLATPSGQPAGDDGGECTVTTLRQTSLNHNDFGNTQCVVTFALPDGEITVQQVGDHFPATVDQAVTGGTGLYRGVKGDCVVSFGPPGSKIADLVFHLSNVGQKD